MIRPFMWFASALVGVVGMISVLESKAHASAPSNHGKGNVPPPKKDDKKPAEPKAPEKHETKGGGATKIEVFHIEVEQQPKQPKKEAKEEKAPPAPEPKKEEPKKQLEEKNEPRTAMRAARDLFSFAKHMLADRNDAALGSSAHPSKVVEQAQRDMKMKLQADEWGIYGPKTMKRGKELLGQNFPSRHPVNAKPPAPPEPQKAKPVEHAPAGDGATAAAEALDALVARQGDPSRDDVSRLQWTMGLDTDGLIGDDTRDKTQELLKRSVNWPPHVPTTGGAPAGDSAEDAARRLVRYVRTYHGTRSERISAYQRALGLPPVGSVGPQTKSKVLQLTGVQL